MIRRVLHPRPETRNYPRRELRDERNTQAPMGSSIMIHGIHNNYVVHITYSSYMDHDYASTPIES